MTRASKAVGPPFSISLLWFTAVAQGYTIFHTKCLVPEASASFVSSPDSRGTLEILWSCGFVIIACTWTIQHLNVPEQREGRDPGLVGDIKWRLKGAWQTTRWMLVTIIAPEFILGKAWGDLEDAAEDLKQLQEFAEEDGVPWTMTHSLFANMGGFVIRSYVGSLATQGDAAIGTSKSVGAEGIELLSQSRSGEEPSNHDMNKPSVKEVVRPKTLSYNDPFHLTAPDIVKLRRSKALPKLPHITVEEINDKSKSDAMVRTIAIVQIGWTIVQVITRAVRNLAVSQLEIAVIAFAACAIITYGLNWNKPKGVLVPLTFLQYKEEIPDSVLASVDARGGTDSSWMSLFLGVLNLTPESKPGQHVNNYDQVVSNNIGNAIGSTIASVLFGGLHLVAWNFDFPTVIETILWRATSLWCTTFFFFLLLISFLGDLLSLPDWSARLIFPLIFSAYVLARLFLMVEIFRCLLFLPPSAYAGTWAANVPHIG